MLTGGNSDGVYAKLQVEFMQHMDITPSGWIWGKVLAATKLKSSIDDIKKR